MIRVEFRSNGENTKLLHKPETGIEKAFLSMCVQKRFMHKTMSSDGQLVIEFTDESPEIADE